MPSVDFHAIAVEQLRVPQIEQLQPSPSRSMEERTAGNLHVAEASTSTAYRPTTFTAVSQLQVATPRVTLQHDTRSSLLQ